MSDTKKGLIINVLRSASGSDCTNNGESSRFDSFVVCEVGNKTLDDIFQVTEDRPELVIEYRPRFNDYIAIPRSILEAGHHYMFGGNFVFGSDSRFNEALGQWGSGAIKVFDRVER